MLGVILGMIMLFISILFYMFLLFGGENNTAITPDELSDLLNSVFHKRDKDDNK